MQPGAEQPPDRIREDSLRIQCNLLDALEGHPVS